MTETTPPPIKRRTSLTCTCGRPKTIYHRSDGFDELVCLPCRSARAAARHAVKTNGDPPKCKLCGQPKSQEASGYSHKGYRWICKPCLRESYRTSQDIEAGEAKVEIPTAAERVAAIQPADEPEPTFTELLCRQYFACERRWKQPVTSPSKAGVFRGRGYREPFPLARKG